MAYACEEKTCDCVLDGIRTDHLSNWDYLVADNGEKVAVFEGLR
jgi:hypothetical protein